MISFGLLNVPVQLFPGERTVDLHFRMLDSRDKKPIRYERVNSETGEEVPWKEIVKAYEYSKNNYVVIDEKEIRKAAPRSTETVEIEAFVEQSEIDLRYFEKPYLLVPAHKSEKAYVLLREILRKSGKLGIAKVVIRTRQYLAALMPCDKALVLILMRFPQELVPLDDLELPEGSLAKYRISAQELRMGEQLVESMSVKWKPAEYKDDFREKLHKFIDAQIAPRGGRKGRVVHIDEEKPVAAGNVIDFASLLKRSLAAQEQPRGNGRQRRGRRTA